MTRLGEYVLVNPRFIGIFRFSPSVFRFDLQVQAGLLSGHHSVRKNSLAR